MKPFMAFLIEVLFLIVASLNLASLPSPAISTFNLSDILKSSHGSGVRDIARFSVSMIKH